MKLEGVWGWVVDLEGVRGGIEVSIDQNILYVCMEFLKIVKCDIEVNKKKYIINICGYPRVQQDIWNYYFYRTLS